MDLPVRELKSKLRAGSANEVNTVKAAEDAIIQAPKIEGERERTGMPRIVIQSP